MRAARRYEVNDYDKNQSFRGARAQDEAEKDRRRAEQKEGENLPPNAIITIPLSNTSANSQKSNLICFRVQCFVEIFYMMQKIITKKPESNQRIRDFGFFKKINLEIF
jgi:hypothetical protein